MPDSSDILPMVYKELRQLAQARLARESPNQTLTPTELVHEAFLRLGGGSGDQVWESKAHFFGAAAIAMRRILIDSARKKIVRRKAGAIASLSLDQLHLSVAMTQENAALMIDLDSCLTEFSEQYPEEGELVKLRFFAGLTMEEASEALGISRRTAQRRWAFAKAQMHCLLEDERTKNSRADET